MTMIGWAAGASTQEATTSTPEPTPVVSVTVDLPAAANEQARIQHARTVEHMERVEAQADEHEAKMAQLGDRAPVETIPPTETVPPPH
jgi:hypothetical protein